MELNGLGDIVWQSRFETKSNRTVFYVTRSEWNGRWCSRIFTHPRMSWSIPGGGPAIKFIADDPEECRDDAIRFLLDCSRRKGYRCAADTPAGGGGILPERPKRISRKIDLVWGMDEPAIPGSSTNVSTSGMFVATDQPPIPGTLISLRVDLGPLSVPLRGRVTWNRPSPNRARDLQAGMGIQLLSPPSIYKGYIDRC